MSESRHGGFKSTSPGYRQNVHKSSDLPDQKRGITVHSSPSGNVIKSVDKIHLTEMSPPRNHQHMIKEMYKQNDKTLDMEIDNLKQIKKKLAHQARSWEKMPQVFKYALELHSKEQLGFQQQIIKLKQENFKLKQDLEI